MRTLGSTVAATLVGVILSSHLVVSGSIGIPTTQAFQLVFGMGAAVALAGVIIGAFIPPRGAGFSRHREHPHPALERDARRGDAGRPHAGEPPEW